MKKITALFLSFCITLSSIFIIGINSFALTSGDFEYSVLSDGTAEITKYTGTAEELTIPSDLDGYIVTRIADDTFSECGMVTGITIPNSITDIGVNTFIVCATLTYINVDVGNAKYYSENGILFNRDKTEIICYPAGRTESSYEISDDVKSIGYGAFAGCFSLENVIIPHTVIKIGNIAFGGCISLKNITIPDSVTEIGEGAFVGCTSFTSVTIPNSITKISNSAFESCESIKDITISSSVTSIGESAFYYCTSLESIIIPDSVIHIGNNAFSDTAYYNKESNWENGVLYIGNHLIKANDTLSGEYSIKEGTKTVSDNAFYDCRSLSSVIIPNGVKEIGNRAFNGCNSITSVTIPNSVTSIGAYAFHNCTSLKQISIPYGVTEIKTNAFDGCNSLTSVTIPSSVTSIGAYAFFDCILLTELAIPNSVTSIGDYAFYYCISLKNITIPNKLTTMGDYIFKGCNSLTSVKIPNSVLSIGIDAFYNCDNLTVYGYLGSYAQSYANGNSISFSALGDTDSDGIINSSDYAVLRDCVMCKRALSEKQRIAADFNADGAVDGFDVIALDLYLNTNP